MKNLRYAFRDRDELPERLDWLTDVERARYGEFRFDKRRQDWLLGRWAAKQALLELAELPQSDIARFEIVPAPGGAPMAQFDGSPHDVGLSISHSSGRAFSVVSSELSELGCDIELVEPRSAAFVDTFFTTTESERVQGAAADFRDILVTMIWSAKESTLKALRTGLRADTRSVEVIDGGMLAGRGWSIARTVAGDAGEFSCLWRLHGEFVLTIAVRDAVEMPEEP